MFIASYASYFFGKVSVGARMRVVPWSHVSSWRCNACGICCKHYDVVLGFPEWLGIVKSFGVEYTASSVNKFFLRRKSDGSCAFLYETPNASRCSLQYMKPKACKLWPFKILDKPKFGSPNDAAYYYGHGKLFVYVDGACTGLRFGLPTREFTYSLIPEFIEIALGLRRRQLKTTAAFLGHSLGQYSY